MRFAHGPTILPLLLLSVAGAQTYRIQTVAGTDSVGDGGAAEQAVLHQPEGIAVDAAGNVYVADAEGHRVRRITRSGAIQTVAGTGIPGFHGDGGPADLARLRNPYDVAVDSAGHLYIADLGNARVRRVSRDGIITTVAGGGNLPPGGDGDGQPATSAQLQAPRNVALDREGHLFVSDFGDHRVYRVDRSGGAITTLAGTGRSGDGGDGGPAFAARLSSPAGLAFDAQGRLYIADSGNRRVRRVDRGLIHTVPTGRDPFFRLVAVAVDGGGNLWVGGDSLVRIDSAGHVARSPQPTNSLAVSSGGLLLTSGPHIYQLGSNGTWRVLAGSGQSRFGGDAGPPLAARFFNPTAVAVDHSGNLLIADTGNQRLRQVAGGVVLTIAGLTESLNAPGAMIIDPGGDLIFCDVRNHRILRRTPGGVSTVVAGDGSPGYSGDGGPANRARLDSPSALVLDASGSLYVADTGNHRVRRIDPAGVIWTVAGNGAAGFGGDGLPASAARLHTPRGLACDRQGLIYVADSGNQRVRRFRPGGLIESVARDADPPWNGPAGLALDEAGNLLVAEAGGHRVRRIGPDGHIATLAGTGEAGFLGEGGLATQAQLHAPAGLAVDARGNIYVADAGNHRIRQLVPLPREVAPAPVVAPRFRLVHAATLEEGPLAPGQQVRVGGAMWPGIEVEFDGIPTPVLAAAGDELRLLVPPSARAGTEARLWLRGALLARFRPTMQPRAPGLFTIAGGRGLAQAVLEDGTLLAADNPARRSSVVSLFVTGIGMEPPAIGVRIRDVDATVLHAAPMEDAPGVWQINVRLPGGFGPGGEWPVTVTADGVSSQPGVVIRVR